MENIQSLLNESKKYTTALRAETQGTVNKWKKTGLLEGISDEYQESGMAILLENQAKQLISEANATSTSANAEEWAGVALPLVRRIFGELSAKEFVSVQPMKLPSGLVFFLEFKYGTAQPGFTTGLPRTSQADSLFGITNTANDPSEGLYGAGRFGYSINETSSAELGFTSGSLSGTTFVTASITNESDFNFDSAFSASYAAGINNKTVYKLRVSASAIPDFDAKGVRAFHLSGSAAGIVDYFPQFTKLVNSNGVSGLGDETILEFIISGSTGAALVETTSKAKVLYQKQPTAANRGDFEVKSPGDSEAALGIPEINVELRSEPIVAKTRKLKASWTPEYAQDLERFHSLDAESSLVDVLNEYVSMEIDLEILDMLIQNAATTEAWSAKVGFTLNDAGTAFVADTSTSSPNAYTQNTWFQTLGTKLQKLSNKIHQKTMRGGANFLVVSPTVATVLESIPGFASTYDGSDKMNYAMGVQKVGMLSNRYTVYKNPYMLENVILMGYRGTQFLETGAVYAPYIPLMTTPLVYDPDNFTPRRGVMTRYAKKMLRPEFYGIVKVHGLNSI